MITAQELKDDYDKKLKKLQNECPHNNQSVWMEHYWAPAHSSGYQVKQCNDCWKILQYKYTCIACDKEFIKEEETNQLQNDCLCDECLKKGKFYCFVHKKFYNIPIGCPKCIEIFEKFEKDDD